MWPIPALKSELVTISLSPDDISCCWLKKSSAQASAYIQAYQRHSLQQLELEKLILFNPTHIKKIITDFLSQNNINNAFISLCLTGSHISEEYITLPISTPKKEDFGISQAHSFLWGYHYLYQNENGQFVFYVYKIPPFILLQYKLLAIATHLNMITMTTKNCALFYCYKNIGGAHFRQTQFAVDMEKYQNSLESFITAQALQKMIIVSPDISIEEELVFLATHYGLFINQGLFP